MNTLVVRPGALGDAILTLPLLHTIRMQDPGGAVVFLGPRAYLPLVPPYVQARPVDDTSALWLFTESPENNPPPDVAFDVAYVILHSPDLAARNLIRSGVKTVKIIRPQVNEGEHLARALHRLAGLPAPEPAPMLRFLAPRERLSAVWLHPGSGGPRKCAPLSTFVSISRLLNREYGLPCVITATDQDAFLAAQPEWKMLLDEPGNRLVMNRPIVELCRELGGAVLFVGNDSGIAHLAANLGVKSLLFFCATDPRVWAPWVPSHQMRIIDCRNRMPDTEALRTMLSEVLVG
ncbi:MAG: glycosyltransferase family 9 protein [Desulfomonilaceae bacterium]